MRAHPVPRARRGRCPAAAARAAGLLLGYAVDRLLADPRRWHPVAGFGIAANALEARLYADTRARGAAHAAILAGGAVVLGAAAERAARSSPWARAVVTAAATWLVLGGRSLEREAAAVQARLADGDLPGARSRLTHLVGRDTSRLGPSELSRAVVESVAENSSDAVVAPLLWGALGGVPGLLGYRAVNTLDAMVGHHNARYERYGWASARLDDVLNLPGARLAGLLTLAAAPSRAREAWRVWRRDAGAHPSPNAGVVEAAFAGALGVRLGGTNVYYGNRVEHRAIMDGGRPPEPCDIPRATALARRVGHGAVVTAAAIAATRRFTRSSSLNTGRCVANNCHTEQGDGRPYGSNFRAVCATCCHCRLANIFVIGDIDCRQQVLGFERFEGIGAELLASRSNGPAER